MSAPVEGFFDFRLKFEISSRTLGEKRQPYHHCSELDWLLAWYTHAIRLLEQTTIPVHGLSIDRRTMQMVTETFNDDCVQSLVCLCCAQVYTSWIGVEVVGADFVRKKTPIAMVQGEYLIEHLIGDNESRRSNFEEAIFRERYMKEASSLSAEKYLQRDNWEWRRRLRYKSGLEVPIVCCPEDVQQCDPSVHGREIICKDCAAPLCRKCGLRMLQQVPVPMAIANHNFIGYCLETLVKYKVRWIEAAAVCPAWTTLICFYMEEDCGHLMNEVQHAPQYKTAVRGNIFSFPMPWVEIMKSLLLAKEPRKSGDPLVPHPPQILAHMVRLHLKLNSNDITNHLKEIKVRTHVLLQLGYDLIEAHHPALVKRTNAGPVTLASIRRIKEEYERTVARHYPSPTDPDGARQAQLREEGVVPDAVLQVCLESMNKKQTQSPLQEKNATPSPGAMEADKVFDAVQPQLVVSERDISAGAHSADIGHAALTKFGDMEIQTGNKFIPQWRPQYLSEVFCFDFKHLTGGPEFNLEDRERHEGAPFVSLFDYTSSLPRRVERHLRASWVLVPAVRNLYFRRALLEASSIAYNFKQTDNGMLEDHSKELCAAAAELYHHLQAGLCMTQDDWPKPG